MPELINDNSTQASAGFVTCKRSSVMQSVTMLNEPTRVAGAYRNTPAPLALAKYRFAPASTHRINKSAAGDHAGNR